MISLMKCHEVALPLPVEVFFFFTNLFFCSAFSLLFIDWAAHGTVKILGASI